MLEGVWTLQRSRRRPFAWHQTDPSYYSSVLIIFQYLKFFLSVLNVFWVVFRFVGFCLYCTLLFVCGSWWFLVFFFFLGFCFFVILGVVFFNFVQDSKNWQILAEVCTAIFKCPFIPFSSFHLLPPPTWKHFFCTWISDNTPFVLLSSTERYYYLLPLLFFRCALWTVV